MDITTIGFDLAKTVFQVHGADAKGRPVLRRKLRRGEVLAFFAGLHDIAPMVSSLWVTSSVRAPSLAAACAASQPAWPPPTTITSQFDSTSSVMAAMIAA